jgi:hypothetical protein
MGSRKVNNLIANGDPHTKLFGVTLAPENREGQVLNREVSAGVVGGIHPAAKSRIMSFVQHCLRSLFEPIVVAVQYGRDGGHFFRKQL